jgi:hypothetical protein
LAGSRQRPKEEKGKSEPVEMVNLKGKKVDADPQDPKMIRWILKQIRISIKKKGMKTFHPLLIFRVTT